jgi:hypothetical protein
VIVSAYPLVVRVYLLMAPESFFVSEREGPLEDGELERAASWAEGVFERFEASRSVQQDKAEIL